MIYSTLRDQNRSFCCQVNGNIMLSKFFLWNEAVEVIEATEVIEAVEAIEAAEVPDGREITQQPAFDFLSQRGRWGHWGQWCYHVCWGHRGHWGFQNHLNP